MEDILSQGGGREPSRWPRRLAVIGVVLLVAVVSIVYFGLEHHRLSPAAAPSPTDSANAGEPGGVGGADLPWNGSLRLPVAGTQPAWYSPATGRSAPIGGLPPDSAGYQFTRAPGGWVVRAGSGGELASGDAAVPSLPVWFLADGAESATRVGTANQVTPAATVGAVWLTSYPATADPDTSVRTAREVSVDGVPMGAPVRLPAGYAIYRATDRGLLLQPASQQSGSQADKLWNPSDPEASRTFDAVIAASPTQIAWMPACAGMCRVQLLDLVTGRQTVVRLPAGGFAASAAFSPTGDLLALQVMTDDGSETSVQLEVASVGSGRLTALPGTTISGDTVVDFGWPTSGDSLVSEFIFPATVQLTAWHPGAPGLAEAVVRSGQEQASLVVG